MYITQFLPIFCVLSLTTPERWKTVYQKIAQEDDYSGFNSLVRSNRIAKTNLHYNDLTVFVPDNSVIDNYEGVFSSDVVFYHMSFEVKTLSMLRNTNNVSSVNEKFPPIWVTHLKEDDQIFVNNAKVLKERSNYLARSRSENGKQQVMHLIDEVLDPFITSSPFNPSAYDFLQSSKLWKIGSVSVGSFFHRIQENRLQHIFSQPGGHTFFIPVDSGIDKYKFSMIDKYVIFGHVIPHMVLFTRPTKIEFYFESLSNGDYIYILLAFVDDSGVLKVKSSTVLGDTTHPQGVQYAKIVKANIPVKNGVVHLISQPLVIFNRKLQPFPFWPIYQKISGDPTLDIVYEMGEKTGFNKIFLNDSLTFTYFIARDSSWNKISQNGLVPIEDTTTLLGRHLVISETPYSMEKLISLSRANNYTDFELNTLSGSLRISVQKIGDDYFIKWYNRYIKVHRPDYECTNGIVHVLDGPITKFKRIGTRVNIKGAMENQEEDGGGFWGSLKRFAESF